MKTMRQLTGAAGEGHACRLLEAKGYVLLARNWRADHGELDLVMRDGDELVFLEVKTRRGERLGRAEEAITPNQQRSLLAAAQVFLAGCPEYQQMVWRIDLVAITLDSWGRVQRAAHIENAVGTW
ncbi:MAG TPA: YraN family protein [Thermomicrobiales bacterium]|nr:YraN family protein [Thermomicrobiales bacterium]